MTPSESYRTIPLSQGQVAIVDEKHYASLMRYKWYCYLDPKMGSFYAVRNHQIPGGHRTTIHMHREILGLQRGDKRRGDHIDPFRTLDNRESNLRIASSSQNQQNRRKRTETATPFKGVTAHKGKFRARISDHGREIHLGYRSTAEAAWLELYVPAAQRLFGKFARAA